MSERSEQAGLEPKKEQSLEANEPTTPPPEHGSEGARSTSIDWSSISSAFAFLIFAVAFAWGIYYLGLYDSSFEMVSAAVLLGLPALFCLFISWSYAKRVPTDHPEVLRFLKAIVPARDVKDTLRVWTPVEDVWITGILLTISLVIVSLGILVVAVFKPTGVLAIVVKITTLLVLLYGISALTQFLEEIVVHPLTRRLSEGEGQFNALVNRARKLIVAVVGFIVVILGLVAAIIEIIDAVKQAP